ncbi:hypothetical protein [Streptomyces tateyamensis]|nr:hypothetical protein [Streptomyces tateyamensis]
MAVLCALVVALVIEAYCEQVRHDRRGGTPAPARAARASRLRRPSRLRLAFWLSAAWLWVQLAAVAELTARQPARHRRPQ